jgi:hypothetical protein
MIGKLSVCALPPVHGAQLSAFFIRHLPVYLATHAPTVQYNKRLKSFV